MLKTRVIPCLTVKNGRLVKSVQFENHRNIGSYIAAARVFNSRNVDELVLLDLGAREAGINPQLLEEVTKECFMPVTLGGGVTRIDDVQLLLESGADKVAINTAALETPDVIDTASARFGAQCVVVSIDVRKKDNEYHVFSRGGEYDTGKRADEWAKEVEARGAGEIFLTSIDRDGMMEGYETELIEKVTASVHIPVIVSGGAGNSDHCVDAIKSGASAVAAASIFQYTQTTPLTIKEKLNSFGISVRLL